MTPSSAAIVIRNRSMPVDAGDHRAHEALVAGDIDDRHAGAAGELEAARSRARSRSPARAPAAAGRCRFRSAPESAPSCRGRCGRRSLASAVRRSSDAQRTACGCDHRLELRRRPAFADRAAPVRRGSARSPAGPGAQPRCDAGPAVDCVERHRWPLELEPAAARRRRPARAAVQISSARVADAVLQPPRAR